MSTSKWPMAQTTNFTGVDEPDENPVPEPTKPEIEPEKLPDEDPGVRPITRPGKDDDDDDDDDPFTETEIGDDPDEISKKTTIM